MMMLIQDSTALLMNLCELPRETNWVEFKSNMNSEENLGKYISALANAAIFHGKDHAFLVFGISDAREIIGTNVDLESQKVGNETILFWLAKHLEPKLSLSVANSFVDGRRVQILCIDPAYQRPVTFKHQSFIRIDTNQQPLGRFPEIERSIWQITSSYSFEDAVIMYNASQEDIRTAFNYKRLIEILGKSYDSVDGAFDALEQQGLLKRNLQNKYDARAILALACAKSMNDHALTRFKSARVINYSDKTNMNALSDQEGAFGYAVAFDKLLSYIMSKVPSTEEMKHGLRVKKFAIPEVAIREILANAIIHQDFTVNTGRPLIEIFSDKIKITNPGEPLIPVDRFISAPSKTRNPAFAVLMRAAGLCESRGSGVDRALNAIEEMTLPPPLFQAMEGSTIVTIFMNKSFASLSAEDRIRACYQHACLRHEQNNYMSNASLRARFDLPQRQYPQVSNVIKEAIEVNLIRPLNDDQGNRVARYVPYWA